MTGTCIKPAHLPSHVADALHGEGEVVGGRLAPGEVGDGLEAHLAVALHGRRQLIKAELRHSGLAAGEAWGRGVRGGGGRRGKDRTHGRNTSMY